MLTVSALCFDYGDKPLLNEVNLTVVPGQLLHLRGRNGVGKTSLLKLLAGLLSPSSGTIYYGNEDISLDLAQYQQALSYVGHKSGLSSLLSLRENYRFEGYELKAEEFEAYLQEFDLLDIANIPCGLLSMGQRRRASLLRLMMKRAKLWLLDEPLTSLDNEAVSLFIKKLESHLQAKGMIIMTSHQELPMTSCPLQEYFL